MRAPCSFSMKMIGLFFKMRGMLPSTVPVKVAKQVSHTGVRAA